MPTWASQSQKHRISLEKRVRTVPWRGPTDTPTPKVRIGTLTHGIWMLQMGCFAPTTHVLFLDFSRVIRVIPTKPGGQTVPKTAKSHPGRQITSEPLTQKLRNPDRRPLLVESFRTVPYSERLEQKSPKSRYSVHHFSRHALSRPNMSTETSLPTT